MKPILIAICALLSARVHASDEQMQKSFSGVRTVTLSSLQGNTQLITTKSNEVSVKIVKRDFSERCDLTIQQSGESLNIEVSKGWLFTSNVNCEMDIVLAVPAQVKIKAFQATGEVVAEGLIEPFSIKSPSARIRVINAPAKEISIDAVSGSVNLIYTDVVPARISVETISGSVKYQSSFSTKIGFRSISGSMSTEGKPVSETATSEVQVNSVSGSLTWQ